MIPDSNSTAMVWRPAISGAPIAPTPETQDLYNKMRQEEEEEERLAQETLQQVQDQATSPSLSQGSTTHSVAGLLYNEDLSATRSRVNKPRAARRSPLSKAQKARAALVRKLKACEDCKRRRVKCAHHDLSLFEHEYQENRQHLAQVRDPVNSATEITGFYQPSLGEPNDLLRLVDSQADFDPLWHTEGPQTTISQHMWPALDGLENSDSSRPLSNTQADFDPPWGHSGELQTSISQSVLSVLNGREESYFGRPLSNTQADFDPPRERTEHRQSSTPKHTLSVLDRLEDSLGEPESPQSASEPRPAQMAPMEAFPASLPDFIDYLLDILPLPSWEPPVPLGKIRVRWNCKCGTRLFDDFTELEPGSLRDLETELRTINGGDSQPRYQNVWSFARIFSAWYDLAKRITNSMRRGSPNDDIPLALRSNVDVQESTSPGTSQDSILHLLCCVQSGETGTRLHQPRVSHVSTDKELILFLNKLYRQQRSITSWLSLRHVSGLLMTRFELDLSNYVQVHLHTKTCQPAECVCLPPRERIVDNEYSCRPAPEEKPKQVPIFGKNYLIHYFKSPACLSDEQTTILNQLPKRQHGCLAASHQETALGWGLYFEEGWHWKTIYFIIVVLIVTGGLVFGVCWSILRADTQSAFGITGCWMTLGALLLGYIAVRTSP